MRQARKVISTYSADTFGVCSALYELGGMIVMHDASGCNSTYSTHDEPRWYRSKSLIFISGLTETDAILGNDARIKDDMVRAIKELHPSFAAVAGTPIPMMTGFDYNAIASEVENETGIPCFGFDTNGMRTYDFGVSKALATVADKMTDTHVIKKKGSVNIIGATPLDFSLGGTVESIRLILEENGYEVISSMAMGSEQDEIKRAGEASVNLVISSTGLEAAKVLKDRFSTPYAIGTPIGKNYTKKLIDTLKMTEKDGVDRCVFDDVLPDSDSDILIIGESVVSRSIAGAIKEKYGKFARVINPLEGFLNIEGILSDNDLTLSGEAEIENICKGAKYVIADPLYKPIVPSDCNFIRFAHEAFSGRIYRKEIKDFTKIEI